MFEKLTYFTQDLVGAKFLFWARTDQKSIVVLVFLGFASLFFNEIPFNKIVIKDLLFDHALIVQGFKYLLKTFGLASVRLS